MSQDFAKVELVRENSQIYIEFLPGVVSTGSARVNVVTDVNRDGIPLGIEAFWVQHYLGDKRLAALRHALKVADLTSSYSEDGDILSLNVNSIGDYVSTQAPATIELEFADDDRLISLRLSESEEDKIVEDTGPTA